MVERQRGGGAVPLSGQWRGGDRAVCRCAAGNGHLLSPCGHCHNRQWNLRVGACPQRKASLCAICGPWPAPLSGGECLCLKLDVYDSTWSSWERPYYAVPTPVKKTQGLPMTRQIQCCLLHDRFLGFPPLPPATPPPPPLYPVLPPLFAPFNSTGGWTSSHVFVALHVLEYESRPPKANASQAVYMAAAIWPFDLSLWGEKAKKMQKPKR